MEKDREKWNKKYETEEYPWEKPSEIVEKFYTLAKNKGKVLDLACGLGRNSIFLAKKGFKVDAVDISDVALQKLKEKEPQVNTINADLDTYNIPENTYDLIININYLNRRLVPQIKEGLKKDGLIIFETFTLSEDKDIMQPKNKDYLLRPNELLRLFSDLYIIFYQERKITKPNGEKAFVSSLVAVKKCLL